MSGTILIYGNEPLLVETRRLILEQAGYEVYATMEFQNAMRILADQAVDLLLLGQSLREDERRGMIETASAMSPEIKCIALGSEDQIGTPDRAEVVDGRKGPAHLLEAIGKILATA